MKPRLSVRMKVLLIAFAINALCMAVYTFQAVRDQKRLFIQGVSEKLKSAAYALPGFLPAGFHDGIQGPESLDSLTYRRLFNANTQYALDIGITYIYSFIRRDGDFYECASSGSRQELENGPDDPFFKKYEQPPANLIRAWETNTVQYDEYTDEFGRFRSIFVPMVSAGGTRYIIGADVSLGFLSRALYAIAVKSILTGLGIFVVVMLLSSLVLNRILSPITRLERATRHLSANDFAFSDEIRRDLEAISFRSRDEIGSLATAFRETASQLQVYIDDLKTTTAAKERVESELRVAHDIQMRFLQKMFPAFPDRPEFDLYARLEPAKQVGGDLYDFLLLDDEHLFFYVGDVSDKGVPAALFMAVTMTLMKRSAQEVKTDPAEILRITNEELSKENENLMFVTLCAAILNIKTGEFVYSNAGHNPPLVMAQGKEAAWLELPHGPALGVMPGVKFANKTAVLNRGEAIFLYTDGINEAMNVKGEQFGNDQLQRMVTDFGAALTEEMVTSAIARVHGHAGDAPQSDDITVMSLRMSLV